MRKLSLNRILNLLKVFINVIEKPFRMFWNYLTKTTFIQPYNINFGYIDLIKNYRFFLIYSIFLSVGIHIFIITVFYINAASSIERERPIEKRIINVTMVDLAPPPSSLQEEVYIPPPPPEKEEGPPPAPKKDLKAFEPKPVRKEQSEEQTIKTQKELDEIKSPVSKEGDTTGSNFQGEIGYKLDEKKIEEKIIKEDKKEKVIEEKSTYQSFEVEKAPEAVNLGQVKVSMDYPSIAIEAGIEGRVTVKVLVDRYGNVTKVGKLTGPEVFHDEVKEKVKDLVFTPGLQNGKPVKVWVTVPFSFKLK